MNYAGTDAFELISKMECFEVAFIGCNTVLGMGQCAVSGAAVVCQLEYGSWIKSK